MPTRLLLQWYPQRVRCLRHFLLIVVVALALWPAAVAAQGEDEPPLPQFLRSGTVEVALEDARRQIAFTETALGPLFALQPLVAWLGGELEVGPLKQSHALQLYDVVALFGPGNGMMTVGREIISLSQPPRAGEGGLFVPLDLLQRTLGEVLGFDLTWDRSRKTLLVAARRPKQLPVRTDLVHIPGVTTVVLHFPERPRYRVEQEVDAVELRVMGDRLIPPSRLPSVEGTLVHRLLVDAEGVRIELAPQVMASSYELQRPFRVVFDIQRQGQAPLSRRPVAPDRRPGLQLIVVDPGHGGGETGASGPTGAREKDLTLLVARSLKRQLESALPVKAVLTRDEDVDLPLDLRSALANQHKSDLFISIHLNSSFGPNARGAETYFLSLEASDARAAASAEIENRSVAGELDSADPLTDLQLILWDLAQSRHLAQSQRFATLVQDELNQALGLRDRGVKQAPFRVLMGAAMPAVLVELGFLSNPDEEAKLLQPAYRSQLVAALVRAVQRFHAQLVGGGDRLEVSAP